MNGGVKLTPPSPEKTTLKKLSLIRVKKKIMAPFYGWGSSVSSLKMTAPFLLLLLILLAPTPQNGQTH